MLRKRSVTPPSLYQSMREYETNAVETSSPSHNLVESGGFIPFRRIR